MAGLRGKILKVPDATPGLLFVNGQQRYFQINGVWRSNTIAPALEMIVDVELNANGEVIAIYPVSDSDLAKEQARLAMDAAGAKGKELASTVVERVGKPTLIAVAVLIFSWFFCDLYSVKVNAQLFSATAHASLWRQVGLLHVMAEDMDNVFTMLGDLNRYTGPHSDMPSTGLLGVLGILALAAPLLPAIWKDKRAMLGATAPLLFLLLLGAQSLRVTHAIQTEVHDSISKSFTGIASLGMEENSAASAQQTAGIQNAIDKQMQEFNKSVHLTFGIGFYLSVIASLYLAGQGGIKYMALKGRQA